MTKRLRRVRASVWTRPSCTGAETAGQRSGDIRVSRYFQSRFWCRAASGDKVRCFTLAVEKFANGILGAPQKKLSRATSVIGWRTSPEVPGQLSRNSQGWPGMTEFRGLKTVLELRVCKPNGLGASLNQDLKF